AEEGNGICPWRAAVDENGLGRAIGGARNDQLAVVDRGAQPLCRKSQSGVRTVYSFAQLHIDEVGCLLGRIMGIAVQRDGDFTGAVGARVPIKGEGVGGLV